MIREGHRVERGQPIGRVGILTRSNGRRLGVPSVVRHLEMYDKTETGALSEAKGTSGRHTNGVPFMRRRDLVDLSAFITRAPLPQPREPARGSGVRRTPPPPPMGLFSSEPPSHFPVVKGRRLDGTKVRFPHDLPADATLLIVSFQDALDPLADQWARLGDRLAEAHGGRFAVIETPVVSNKLRLLGDLATMGVRGQVESEAERERTVPLFADVKTFRKRLQVKTRDVYPILVARDGRIAWRGDGDIDMEEVEALEAAVGEVLSSPVPPLTDHPDVDDDPEPVEAEAVETPEPDGDAPPQDAELEVGGHDGPEPPPRSERD